MLSYYRKFVPHFADIASPLQEMAKKFKNNKKDNHKKLVITAETRESLEALKTAITTEPVTLSFPQWDMPFEVHCDASSVGISAVLYQLIDGEERVIMYASRSQSSDERNYHIYEQECLAIVWALKLFHHYLYLRDFTVVTDCKALQYALSRPDSSRLTKWLLHIQEYAFKIKHKQGARHLDVDAMTRQHLESCAPYGEDDIEVLYGSKNKIVLPVMPTILQSEENSFFQSHASKTVANSTRFQQTSGQGYPQPVVTQSSCVDFSAAATEPSEFKSASVNSSSSDPYSTKHNYDTSFHGYGRRAKARMEALSDSPPASAEAESIHKTHLDPPFTILRDASVAPLEETTFPEPEDNMYLGIFDEPFVDEEANIEASAALAKDYFFPTLAVDFEEADEDPRPAGTKAWFNCESDREGWTIKDFAKAQEAAQVEGVDLRFVKSLKGEKALGQGSLGETR